MYENKYPSKLFINNIDIKIPKKTSKKKYKYDILLCIVNMIKYSSPNQLIQIIESYRYLGVNHFDVYPGNISKEVKKVLLYYNKLGILTIINRNIHIENEVVNYLYFGQIQKSNDCLYRNMYRTKNLIITDLDEIIWPYKFNTVKDMLIKYDNLKSNGYFFYSRLFKTESINYHDAFMLNSKDINMFNYHEYCNIQRTAYNKYIIHNLSTVNEIEAHVIRDYDKNFVKKFVKYEYGFIRHTRRYRNDMKNLCKSQWRNFTDISKECKINENVNRVINVIRIKRIIG